MTSNRRFGLFPAWISANGLYLPGKFTPSADRTVRTQTLAAAAQNDECRPGVLKIIAVSNATPAASNIRIRAWDKTIVDLAPTPAGDPVFDVTLATAVAGSPSPVIADVRFQLGAIIKVEGLQAGQQVSITYQFKGKRRFRQIDNHVGSTHES